MVHCDNLSSNNYAVSQWTQVPVGTAFDINFIYTDSAKVEAILTAPVHVDYSNLDFEYSEFPDGLEITFFDDYGNKNKVYANYGLVYNESRIAELKKGVKLISYDGAELDTDQLFWDSRNNWLFTEKPFNFKNQDYEFDAIRLDTDRNFSNFQSGELIGSVYVVEETIDSLEVNE